MLDYNLVGDAGFSVSTLHPRQCEEVQQLWDNLNLGGLLDAVAKNVVESKRQQQHRKVIFNNNE
jgi:hypothetical protein